MRQPAVRSDFLVHWTGKDIEARTESALCVRSTEYTARLRDILHNGLWMSDLSEPLMGNDGKPVTFADSHPTTCFTEIRLSQVREHAHRYGHLGIGFSRSFITALGGTPVHYVPCTEEDAVATNLRVAKGTVETIAEWVREGENYGETFNIETAIQRMLREAGPSGELHDLVMGVAKWIRLHTLEFQSDGRSRPDLLDTLSAAVDFNLRFLKQMSDVTEPHDFRYLDEAEWRVLYSERMGTARSKIAKAGTDRPRSKIRFERPDLRMLIFPDPSTRQLALSDHSIKIWLGDDLPIIATVDDCVHF